MGRKRNPHKKIHERIAVEKYIYDYIMSTKRTGESVPQFMNRFFPIRIENQIQMNIETIEDIQTQLIRRLRMTAFDPYPDDFLSAVFEGFMSTISLLFRRIDMKVITDGLKTYLSLMIDSNTEFELDG